mmetsp:Transcript_5184/g.10262  ORF Transcript_5184/g.10262 Transcript_5184/m.10262 type:complete len:242 (+) Transcript_5184:118-843(+)
MGRWDDHDDDESDACVDKQSKYGSIRPMRYQDDHRNEVRGKDTTKRGSRERSRSPRAERKPRSRDNGQHTWGKIEDRSEEDAAVDDTEPEPDFGLSGALAKETNTVDGVVLKYNEPPEASLPSKKWRLYIFKDGKPFDEPLMLHKQTAFLFGRDRRVTDVPTDHPSCSLQHAVVQYRTTEKTGKDGLSRRSVRPYIIDLGSTNGTFLNGERIESERYYELFPKDVLTFGNSSREYVLVAEY